MAVNLFDANFYRSANPDLASFSDDQASSHFQNYGLNEGRGFSALVDLNIYRSSNADLAGFNNQQAFSHLQNYGVAEGRRFSQLADLNIYRSNNADLASFSNEDIFNHLQNSGVAEGRRFSLFVDLNLYKLANPDLKAQNLGNRQLLEHLVINGIAEGRRFSVAFDTNSYRSANFDLASAGLNNIQLLNHFERYGLFEGRSSSESFNPRYYLDTYSDLRAAGFNYQQAHQHFELFGLREGRFGAPSGGEVILPNDPNIGNTLGTSISIGILNGSRSLRESVGITDRDDYYRFTLASTSNFNLSLSGLSGSANVQLILDNNGNGQLDSSETIDSKNGSSSNIASISSPLGAGTYFVRVNTQFFNTTSTNYTLSVSATTISPTLPRDPGNILNDALNIGILSTNNLSDFIGSVDRDDYYRFTLASTSNFNLSLSGLNNNANVQLIFDSNGNGVVDFGETLDSKNGSSSNIASINSPLGAGSYFIRVNTSFSSSINTNYSLSVSATAIPVTLPRDPGNTLGTALDIGSLSGSRTFSDFVGNVDRDDYYRFTLSSNRNFNLSLSGLNNTANVQLIFDSNGNGVVDFGETLDSRSSNNNASISASLGGGTYFVRVNTSSFSTSNTIYNLLLS